MRPDVAEGCDAILCSVLDSLCPRVRPFHQLADGDRGGWAGRDGLASALDWPTEPKEIRRGEAHLGVHARIGNHGCGSGLCVSRLRGPLLGGDGYGGPSRTIKHLRQTPAMWFARRAASAVRTHRGQPTLAIATLRRLAFPETFLADADEFQHDEKFF